MIRKILDDFYFRNWGFKNEHISFAYKTINNYEKYIKGGKLDTKVMKRYINRIKRHFNLLQPTVSICACGSNEYYVEQYKDVTKYYCKDCNKEL